MNRNAVRNMLMVITGYMLVIIFVFFMVQIFNWGYRKDTTPIVTNTLTETVKPKPTTSATPSPTETAKPEPTNTVMPGPTETVKPEPTKTQPASITPTPALAQVVNVHTGWGQGYLHFRQGPSPRFLPIWPFGWLPENTQLIWFQCVMLTDNFTWAHVGYVDKDGVLHAGYVYSLYIDPNPCNGGGE